MKRTLFLTFCVALFALVSRAQDLSYLQGIQYKIDGALGQAFTSGNTTGLDSLLSNLKALQPQNNMVKQWTAYALMNKSLYLMRAQSKELGEVVREGIALLEGLDKKNSEDYALLGSLQSLATSTLQGMQAGVMAGKATENADKARQLDSTNLRAWYVLGSLDFYTPAMYGGGKKAEGYLLKGLACKDQSLSNPYLPSWGREQIYVLLLTLYQQKGDMAKAEAILNEAKAAFPHNPMWAHYEEKVK